MPVFIGINDHLTPLTRLIGLTLKKWIRLLQTNCLRLLEPVDQVEKTIWLGWLMQAGSDWVDSNRLIGLLSWFVKQADRLFQSGLLGWVKQVNSISASWLSCVVSWVFFGVFCGGWDTLTLKWYCKQVKWIKVMLTVINLGSYSAENNE